MIKYFFLPFIYLSVGLSQTGREIAVMMDESPSPKDMSSQTTMILTNSKGKSRTNKMVSKTVDNSEKQITWFLEPKDDKGVAFLKIEHSDRDDEMRMWLPAFKKVRRISAKKKGDAFMGSDLSYEDMTSRSLNENKYERLDDTSVNGKDCFILEVIPNSSAHCSALSHSFSVFILGTSLFISNTGFKKLILIFSSHFVKFINSSSAFPVDPEIQINPDILLSRFSIKDKFFSKFNISTSQKFIFK